MVPFYNIAKNKNIYFIGTHVDAIKLHKIPITLGTGRSKSE